MNLSYDPIAEDFILSDPAVPDGLCRVYIDRDDACAALAFVNSLRKASKGIARTSIDKPREIVYDECQVRRFTPGGKPKLELEDLILDFEDEEIFG